MTWEYLPVLNACIMVMATIGLGVTMAHFKIFDISLVPVATKFVFFVALPCLVIRGIGINVDFYSENFIWEYIFAFLILRAIALVLSFGSIVIQRTKSPESTVGIGHLAVRWLSLTWISTIIMGRPIMTALLGNEQRGGFLGLLAGISSFIFQLPFLLFFLEWHASEQEQINGASATGHEDLESAVPDEKVLDTTEPSMVNLKEAEMTDVAIDSEEVEVKSRGSMARFVAFWTDTEIWKKVLPRVIKNPVLIGIFLGFLISLTTFGKNFLNRKGDHYVEGLAWIESTLAWFGACVSPVSLFAMGVWMQHQGRNLISVGPLVIIRSMVLKLVLVPLVMVGVAKALGLDDETGRAAILIASLPISLASFTLADQYKIGEGFLSANVAVGTLLMLPTVIIWNLVMDAVDLYPNYKLT